MAKYHDSSRLWALSITLTIVFFVSILLMWAHIVTRYHTINHQLSTPERVSEELGRYHYPSKNKLVTVPTGLFLQSFYFENPQTVMLTGYVWQKYSKEAQERKIKQGFFFPEGNSDTEPELFDSVKYDDYELVGWRFQGKSIYQKFDYSRYPFDRQVIRIRLMPKEFYQNVVMTPDLSSYRSTRQPSVFGVAADIAFHGLKVKETYFDYVNYKTDTNFGLKDYAFGQTRPELNFNLVIQRHFIDIFLLYLLPVVVVWGFLFGLTMMMSSSREKADAYSFTTMESLSTLAAVFLSVLFAQLNLRSNFSGYPVLYLEYFYFVTYAAIFLLAFNAYLVSNSDGVPALLAWRHNLLPKLLFWPFLLGMMVLITWLQFYV